jgi:hypothetical protein
VYSARGGGPIEEVRSGALGKVFCGAETKWKSVGVQLGLSTAVWGFKSGKSSMIVNICRSKTRTSVRRGTCPPGTHTFDIWLPT